MRNNKTNNTKDNMKTKKIKYDCLKCTGYCCSYDRIEVSEKDIKRLAKHFGVTEHDVRGKHLKTYKIKEKKSKSNSR